MNLPASAPARYARQLRLPGFGPAAQARLAAGRVLVIGAGGLGCPALLHLACAGVGHLHLLDPDRVELSNLPRQTLYTEADVGRLKVEAARDRLLALNPALSLVVEPVRFARDRALDLVRSADVVVDGSDNLATRYLVNDACVLAARPFVYGAVQGFEGQVSVFNWRGGPTYRCLFPQPPPPGLAPSCAEAGVLGVLPGLVGTWQATETIKLLADIGEPLSGRVLHHDAFTGDTRLLRLRRSPAADTVRDLPPDPIDTPACASALELSPEEAARHLAAGARWVDVREPAEWAAGTLPGALRCALSALERGDTTAWAALPTDRPLVLYCAGGVRSLRALAAIQTHTGRTDLWSLRGGLAGWARAPAANP